MARVELDYFIRYHSLLVNIVIIFIESKDIKLHSLDSVHFVGVR